MSTTNTSYSPHKESHQYVCSKTLECVTILNLAVLVKIWIEQIMMVGIRRAVHNREAINSARSHFITIRHNSESAFFEEPNRIKLHGLLQY